MSDDVPTVDPAELGPPSREGPVVGVLLAAGDSQRYGDDNKLLADVDGEPMVRRAARGLTASRLERVIAVVGHEADRVRSALAGLDLEVVENPDYGAGQATSLEVGTRAAREAGAAAACYALGDMPWVAPGTVDALVDAYRADAGDPLAAAYEGRRGNPTLFDARHFGALEDVDGDIGGRELLLDDDRARLVETGDPGVRRDVDAREDLPEGG
ncbi:MAG: nucleotidyltransferase family protein [Halobacteriales archaeon]|nr:nucleotidyltransferase family protein [Halobacteriales archaeon]